MRYIVTASTNEARERLYNLFDRHNEELKIAKYGSSTWLVKDDGRALERAYREKLRDTFGVNIYYVEEIHDRDIPEEVKRRAEWNVNHPNAAPPVKSKAVEEGEIASEEALKECQPEMEIARSSEEELDLG